MLHIDIAKFFPASGIAFPKVKKCVRKIEHFLIGMFRSIRRSQNKGRAEEMKRSDMAKESEMTKNALAVNIGGQQLKSKFFCLKFSFYISEWFIKY